MRVFLLACFGRERRPRVVKDGARQYARNHARRWWTVRADSADHARELIATGRQSWKRDFEPYDVDKPLHRQLRTKQDDPDRGPGIIDCGRNARET